MASSLTMDRLNGRCLASAPGCLRFLPCAVDGSTGEPSRDPCGPICPRPKSSARLRSSLWRLRADGFGLLTANGAGVGLSPAVAVDVEVACSWAGRMIDGSASEQDLSWWSQDRGSVDVLPGWDEEWVIVDRERVRHRMLHGLEALSRRLIEAGRAAEAVEPAIVAVGFDPLRESAQRALISARLAEGNVREAQRVFESYRAAAGARDRSAPRTSDCRDGPAAGRFGTIPRRRASEP